MAHVVAVADIAHPKSLEAAEVLEHGHVIGEALARVAEIAQPIDDGHLAEGAHRLQISVFVDPRHDQIGVAGEDPDLILEVSQGEVRAAPVEVKWLPTHLANPDLERYPGSGRGLLEEQGD